MIPNVDFDDLAVNMLPLEQRLPFWELTAKAFMSPVKYNNNVFQAFMNGDIFPQYNSGTTYAKGNKVTYKFATYLSLTDGNVGNAPDISPDQWQLRNKNFIGVNTRIKYNGRKLTFELALNTYFGTTFRQPDNAYAPTPSDIYITNDPPQYTSFIMSGVGAIPVSYMYPGTSTGLMFDPAIFPIASFYKFKINMPLAVYNALGATNPIRETVVRGFADKYTISGTQYTIITY